MLTRLLVCGLVLHAVIARPTLYKKNANDNLEAVLVPVSSTVIPLSVYKVVSSVDVRDPADNKHSKPSVPIKLLTASRKKVSPATGESAQVNIKQISKDQFSQQNAPLPF